MAEGGEGALPSTQETSGISSSGVNAVKPQEFTTAEIQTQGKGFFGRLLEKLNLNKVSKPENQLAQESDQQIRDELARLQADRKNIKSAMNFSDSTGSSKIADAQRLTQIDKQITDLQPKLQPETKPTVREQSSVTTSTSLPSRSTETITTASEPKLPEARATATPDEQQAA